MHMRIRFAHAHVSMDTFAHAHVSHKYCSYMYESCKSRDLFGAKDKSVLCTTSAMAMRRSQPPRVTDTEITNIMLDNISTERLEALNHENSTGEIIKLKFKHGGRPEEDWIS